MTKLNVITCNQKQQDISLEVATYLFKDRQLFICGYQSSLIQKLHHLTWRREKGIVTCNK